MNFPADDADSSDFYCIIRNCTVNTNHPHLISPGELILYVSVMKNKNVYKEYPLEESR